MFFWGICGGESGLPILLLRHLRTAPLIWRLFQLRIWITASIPLGNTPIKIVIGNSSLILCVISLWNELMRWTSFDNILLSSFIPFESPASFPPSLHFSPLSILFLWLLLPSPPLFTLFCLSVPWRLLWLTISTLLSLITLLHLSLFYACLVFFFSSMNSLDFSAPHCTFTYLSVLSGCHPGLTEVFIDIGNLSSLFFFFPTKKKIYFCNLMHTGLWVLTVILVIHIHFIFCYNT